MNTFTLYRTAADSETGNAERASFVVDTDGSVTVIWTVYVATHGGCKDDVRTYNLSKTEARQRWVNFIACGFDRDTQAEACAAGLCEHYTCTEGASVDEWAEPQDMDALADSRDGWA